MVRASDSRLQEARLEVCTAVSNFGQVRSFCIALVHTELRGNDYLAIIDCVGYMCMSGLRALIAEWLDKDGI